MADSFDPYRKWLAIPAEEQPPHFYRLLAIPPFESDPDVISNAVDGRMSQIKSHQTGPYAKLSQQILNEIAAAKVCLLDPKKKAAYDKHLREQLQPAAQGAEFDLSSLPTRSLPRTAPSPKKRKKAQSWLALAVVAGALSLAGGAAAIVFMAPPASPPKVGDGSNQPSPPAPLPRTSAIAADEGRIAPSPPAPLPQAGEGKTVSSKPALEKVAASSAPPAKPEESSDHPATVADQPPAPASESPATEPPPADSKPQPKADEKPDAGPKNLPVPSDKEQQAAERQIREIFQKEYAAAKSAETRSALAEKLMEQAGKSGNDASAEYVLCKLTAQEYAAAGKLDKAMEIVDTTMGRYDTDVSRLKAEVLASSLGGRGKLGPIDPDIAHGICNTAMKMAEAAVAVGDVEAAGQFARVASSAASRLKDPQLMREAANRTREIDRLKLRFAVVQKALDALKADPADADANLKAGQWFCFVKGKWDQGLPMLVKGSNHALAEVAKQDLAGPGDAKQQTALADAWWNVGERESPADKAAMEGRARHWYEKVLDKTTGLEKARIQKRLEEEIVVSPTPTGRQLVVDVTDLPFVGKTVHEGKQYDIIIDSLNLWKGFTLPQPSIPGVAVKHFFFLHATSELQINL